MMTLVSIGKAAKMLGVTPETLRRWEKENKLVCKRTMGKQRRYDFEELKKLFDVKGGNKDE